MPIGSEALREIITHEWYSIYPRSPDKAVTEEQLNAFVHTALPFFLDKQNPHIPRYILPGYHSPMQQFTILENQQNRCQVVLTTQGSEDFDLASYPQMLIIRYLDRPARTLEFASFSKGYPGAPGVNEFKANKNLSADQTALLETGKGIDFYQGVNPAGFQPEFFDKVTKTLSHAEVEYELQRQSLEAILSHNPGARRI